MVKSMPSLGITPSIGRFFIPIIFIILFLQPFYFYSQSAEPALTQPRDEIWNNSTVSDNVTVSEAAIVIVENLTIGDGGRLTIRNSTLQMSPTFNSSSYIDIKGGGTFTLLDSKILSTTTYSYDVFARAGSSLSINRSEIYKCGYKGGDVGSGLTIFNDDSTIEDTKMYIEGVGLSALSGTVYLYNTTFFPSYPTHDMLTCSEIIYCQYGNFYAEGCTFIGVQNPNASYPMISSCHFMPRYSNAKVIIRNSTFVGSDSIIDGNCSLSNVTWTGNTSNWLVSVIGDPAVFEKCTINNSKGVGLSLYRSNPIFYNSTVHGSTYKNTL